MKARTKAKLIDHRQVAALFGVSVKSWRRWVDCGKVPVPHSSIGTLLFYEAAVVDHRIATGLWPAGVAFKGEPCRTAPSAAETPSG